MEHGRPRVLQPVRHVHRVGVRDHGRVVGDGQRARVRAEGKARRGGVSGVVDEIHLAITILSTEDDEIITIPNKHIVGEILSNSFANKIVEGTVGISYQDDPEKAIEAIQTALLGIEDVCSEPPPQVGIEAFGDSSIDLGLRYWVPTKKYFQTLYRGNMAVHKALESAGITIPFPQRDVHLKQKATE